MFIRLISQGCHYIHITFGILLIFLFGVSLSLVWGLKVPNLSFMSSSIASSSLTFNAVGLARREVVVQEGLSHGLSSEQIKEVVKRIDELSELLSDTYLVSDTLSVLFYTFYSLAEIGEYDLSQKDILTISSAFEKLSQRKVDQSILGVISQIKAIRFGRHNGELFAQIFARDVGKGVALPIHRGFLNDDSSTVEIKQVTIGDGARLSFSEVLKTQEVEEAKKFVKRPIEILGGLEIMQSHLNQVDIGIKENIDKYFMVSEMPFAPLWVTVEDVSAKVETKTVFKSIEFELDKALILPNMMGEGKRKSSLLFHAVANVLEFKGSIEL